MIDAALSAAVDRLAARERDVRGMYAPGFQPENGDVAGPATVIAGGGPLSVAAPEGVWFATTDAAGSLRFTRDGGFAVRDGALVDGDGRPLLGFAPGVRRSVAPLRIDPIDAALGRASAPAIDADGSFGYVRTTVDPRTGERRAQRVVVGRVALARFPAGSVPVRVDARGVAAPPGVTARFGAPADGSFAALHVGARDLGRVDVLAGIERLREAYDGFEALRAANHARGSLEKTTMDLLK